MKNNLIAEEYKYTTRERDWGACQENDTSESAYSDITNISYRIRNGNKIIADGFSDLKSAKAHLILYERNQKDIEKTFKALKREAIKSIKEFEKSINEELQNWKKLQLKRKKMIEKGSYLGELKNLSNRIPLLNRLDQLVGNRGKNE